MIRSTITVPLARLVGLSPRNVRGRTEPAEVADLAASIQAVGLIAPLVVERDPAMPEDGAPFYLVVDGGRRFTALQSLAAAGTLGAADLVPVAVLDADEPEAREISLAANVLRRDLHPVEEFEAFARLAAEGFSVERIAADFGRSVRFVRQRLAFDRLSPRVRDLWRAGRMTADVAAAFTRAASVDAQDAYLDEVTARGLRLHLSSVNDHFGPKGGVRADSAEALYVGLDAYQAAGGTIDDNLFGEWSICEHRDLLLRLASEKMMAEGAALMESLGFGSCFIERDVERSWTWGKLKPDVTETDRADLAAIDAAEAAAEEAATDEDDFEILHDAFEARRRVIHRRGILRGSTADERARAAIFLSLDRTGCLVADLGRTPPPGERSTSATAAPRGSSGNSASEPDPVEPEKAPGKAVIECCHEARTRAFATLVSTNPGLAMLVCTAALQAMGNRSPVRISVGARNDVIKEANPVGFAKAIEAVCAIGDEDGRTDAFARAVAQTIGMATPHYGGMQSRADALDTAALGAAMAAYTGDVYTPALVEALDYDAYFKAATRAAALTAIEEAGGDINAARKLKAPAVAAMAAELTRDKGWLPKELRPVTIAAEATADGEDEPASLADAMADAIAADEAPIVTPAESQVAEFLSVTCVEDARASVKFDALYQAFWDWFPDEMPIAVWGEKSFDEAMEGLGFPGRHEAGEDVYPGLRFATPAASFRVADFLSDHCETVGGARVKAAALFDAYRAAAEDDPLEAPTVQLFSSAVMACGIDKKRLAAGVVFLDIRPRDAAQAQAAE